MFVSNRMAIFHQGSVTESFPVVRSGYYSDSILIKDTGKSFNNENSKICDSRTKGIFLDIS